jgi:hypothetical protein
MRPPYVGGTRRRDHAMGPGGSTRWPNGASLAGQKGTAAGAVSACKAMLAQPCSYRGWGARPAPPQGGVPRRQGGPCGGGD